MTDFVKLKARVLGPEEVLFDEAARCYDAKVFRAARILIWLCVAESLERKIRELSGSDDEAGRAVHSIETVQTDKGPVDEVILNSAAKLGLITDTETIKLKYIRDMRSAAAHPSSDNPSAEEILASAVDAVEIVLSRPTLLTHGYVDDLLDSIFVSNYHRIPEDLGRARDSGAMVGSRLKPEAVGRLIRGYVQKLKACESNPLQQQYLSRRVAYLTGVLSSACEIHNSTWNLSELLERYPRAVAPIAADPDIWPRLDGLKREQALKHLLEPINEDGSPGSPDSASIMSAQRLRERKLLSLTQSAQLTSVIQSASVPTLKAAGIDSDIIAKKIIAALESHDWNEQNPAVAQLIGLGPEGFRTIGLALQIELGRNILQAAEGSSHGAQGFISRELSEDSWPEGIAFGVLLESFVNNENRFRLKRSFLAETLGSILKRTDRAVLIEKAAMFIRSSSPKDPDSISDDYEQAVLILGTLSGVERLAQAITYMQSGSSTGEIVLRPVARTIAENMPPNTPPSA